MTNTFASKVIEAVSHDQFKGDALLAFLWNGAASILGIGGIPSRAASSEEELRQDVEVLLSRTAYLNNPVLQALRTA